MTLDVLLISSCQQQYHMLFQFLHNKKRYFSVASSRISQKIAARATGRWVLCKHDEVLLAWELAPGGIGWKGRVTSHAKRNACWANSSILQKFAAHAAGSCANRKKSPLDTTGVTQGHPETLPVSLQDPPGGNPEALLGFTLGSLWDPPPSDTLGPPLVSPWGTHEVTPGSPETPLWCSLGHLQGHTVTPPGCHHQIP